MNVARLVATGAMIAALAACGGGSSGGTEKTYERDAVATCLGDAGVKGIKKLDAGDVPGGLAKAGAIQGTSGRTAFALVFEPDDAAAQKSGKRLWGLQGGNSPQSQVIADVLVTRSSNVVIAYQRPPTLDESRAVAGCLGGQKAIEKVSGT